MVAADWQPYALPLKRPWRTSRGEFDQREGRLLRLQSADGLTGWGDCAPLPEFGISEASATAFAEECAHLDLIAQQAGLPLNAWLSGEPPESNLTVNRNFGPILKCSPDALADAADAGFSLLKLKVGAAQVNDEIAALHHLAGALPSGLSLRLDANRAWNFAEAQSFIAACAGLPIEGLEEPLAEPTPDLLQKLQSTAAFPLAIDESIHLLDAHFFRHPPVRRIVIKPARHGGLLASVELALRARASGIEVIITSSLESACGLLACAHLAASVAPDAVHGLATADWFTEDTGSTPAIVGGQLQLPSSPGLGFQSRQP
ncbi:MAG: o-succinylbenzoate synthase [Gammaproteobacteria bacterium]|nr:o-succinylbenzoate synthase [Gammaproteobacteria bacterium]MBU1602223.1 o-succinylbenzoate synthase [Gammaproteobacteria bacterium]MBU2434270.1 o-succinylbenzoate synthase [Gammaproteobacteria bacterium]MBU2448405.1 o-succinylbenzoate synthase [Gammaproteobacteria bacterium]